jgi:hypothetical protein
MAAFRLAVYTLCDISISSSKLLDQASISKKKLKTAAYQTMFST